MEELQQLQEEKWLLVEETAATASAIEAMKKAHQEELSQELSKTWRLQQGLDGLQKQRQSDVEVLEQELQVLLEQYSQKCLEIGALMAACQGVLAHLAPLPAGEPGAAAPQPGAACPPVRGDRSAVKLHHLTGMGSGCRHSNKWSSCQLEVLLRVKENELQYLKKEVQCLQDELQVMQKDKCFTSGKYQDIYMKLSHIKMRSEQEIKQLKEHLHLAMATLQEKDSMHHILAE
ncbi:hypothetical protein P7K49_007739 [Saguinus oedipus]|uniref:Uncharacterized protein n=1 Tax=Saguinus oedipus TaxID=9490 RepID=A0ABQ9VVQ1_SAGOE|nr:hypothetical protein P7K49_007739 [Saguinus oedipus]